MKHFFTFCCFLLIISTVRAQQSTGVGQQNNRYDYFVRKVKIPGGSDSKIVVNSKHDTTLVVSYKSQDAINNTFQEFTKTYKGTPFFRNGWYNGTLAMETGAPVGFLMAYNVEKNVVYVVEDATSDARLIRPQTFTVEGHTFSQINGNYYETVYKGQTMVLKAYACQLISNRQQERTGYESEGGESEFEGVFVKTINYFIFRNEEFTPIPKNKRIFKLFGDKQSEMEKYAKASKINTETDTGLKTLFTYYDSLK